MGTYTSDRTERRYRLFDAAIQIFNESFETEAGEDAEDIASSAKACVDNAEAILKEIESRE